MDAAAAADADVESIFAVRSAYAAADAAVRSAYAAADAAAVGATVAATRQPDGPDSEWTGVAIRNGRNVSFVSSVSTRGTRLRPANITSSWAAADYFRSAWAAADAAATADAGDAAGDVNCGYGTAAAEAVDRVLPA